MGESYPNPTPAEPVSVPVYEPVTQPYYPPPSSKRKLWLILGTLGLAAVAAVIGWTYAGNFSSTKTQPAVSSTGNTSTSSAGALAAGQLYCPTDLVYNDVKQALANSSKACAVVISNQSLSEIPSEVFQITGLKELRVGSNNLTSVPKEIGNLRELVVLGLQKNKLTSLPDDISKLTKLQKLFLDFNNFSPAEQQHIKSLLPDTTITF